MSDERFAATKERAVARRSAALYAGISLSLAGAFFLSATLLGSYDAVARIGGAVWVFLLSMIVTMPLVTSWVKRRAGVD
ncbi:MAG TPA: hypothetical protein VJ787_13590 [Thermoleophilia bacterium]|nr:hypothetical protein [Thermoleophilia bacterium]